MEEHRPSGGMLTPVTRRKHWLLHKRRRRQAQRNGLLGALLVGLIVVFVLYINISYLHQAGNNPTDTVHDGRTQLRGKSKKAWVSQSSQPFNENSKASQTHHLIVVAGHSVTVAGNLEDAGTEESVWYLLDYQKGKGLPEAILAHIRAGIAEATRDPDSLLIFSGGETRAVTGPFTEGSSYFRVADAMNLWTVGNDSSSPKHTTVRARTVTEEFATDSFENLMFSICRFKEVTGAYPTKITVVSFTFKQRRFEKIHAPALQWPSHRFRYVGVDPPAYTGFDLKASTRGELQNAALPFEKDPYGCHTPVLQEKRKSRNPFSRTPPYDLSCPELKNLFHYCGTKPIPKSQLPWTNAQ